MKITAVEELSKSRSKVYLDGEFAFVLYKGELRLYHIQVGQELSEADRNEVMTKVLPKHAKLRAMNLLKSREYTEKQLHDKLRLDFYPEEVIQEALGYVAGYRYTDDLRYAVTYITDHENTRSRMRIEHDLLAKGISGDVLEKAWEEWEGLGGTQDEEAMIAKLLEKKNYNPENTDPKEYRRIYAFLMRKGFSGDSIRKVMKTKLDIRQI